MKTHQCETLKVLSGTKRPGTGVMAGGKRGVCVCGKLRALLLAAIDCPVCSPVILATTILYYWSLPQIKDTVNVRQAINPLLTAIVGMQELILISVPTRVRSGTPGNQTVPPVRRDSVVQSLTAAFVLVEDNGWSRYTYQKPTLYYNEDEGIEFFSSTFSRGISHMGTISHDSFLLP